MTVFAHSQTTNKLVNKAANDSTRVSGQDRKKPPALGTNQIPGFGGFQPLASLEKNKLPYSFFLQNFCKTHKMKPQNTYSFSGRAEVHKLPRSVTEN